MQREQESPTVFCQCGCGQPTKFDQVALRLELMADQIQEVNRGSLKALQHARVLPPHHVGWPVPSTFPPPRNSDEIRKTDAIVDGLLGRARDAAE